MKLPKLFTHKPDIGDSSIIDSNGNLVALSVSEMDINSEKQAAEIAKRCNAYDELVSNLKLQTDALNKLNNEGESAVLSLFDMDNVIYHAEFLLKELGENSK